MGGGLPEDEWWHTSRRHGQKGGPCICHPPGWVHVPMMLPVMHVHSVMAERFLAQKLTGHICMLHAACRMLQNDGNLVLFAGGTAAENAIWATHTGGRWGRSGSNQGLSLVMCVAPGSQPSNCTIGVEADTGGECR